MNDATKRELNKKDDTSKMVCGTVRPSLTRLLARAKAALWTEMVVGQWGAGVRGGGCADVGERAVR